MAKTIYVKGVGKPDNRVILFERDAAHPNGEVFVVNNGRSFEVAETKAIKRLIGEERLERTDEAPVARSPRGFGGRRGGKVEVIENPVTIVTTPPPSEPKEKK